MPQRHALFAAPLAALAALAALAGCAGTRVASRADAAYPPKPDDCAIEFLYKAPDRPYQELGDLEQQVTNPPPGGAVQALRSDACQLGADAVIVTRDFVTNAYGHALVSGTAIKYVEPSPPPPQEEPPARGPAPGKVDL